MCNQKEIRRKDTKEHNKTKNHIDSLKKRGGAVYCRGHCKQSYRADELRPATVKKEAVDEAAKFPRAVDCKKSTF